MIGTTGCMSVAFHAEARTAAQTVELRSVRQGLDVADVDVTNEGWQANYIEQQLGLSLARARHRDVAHSWQLYINAPKNAWTLAVFQPEAIEAARRESVTATG